MIEVYVSGDRAGYEPRRRPEVEIAPGTRTAASTAC
jgi:hypothetical protein